MEGRRGRYRILVVDDEKHTRHLLEVYLFAHQVISTSCGEQAFRHLFRSSFDLIITDIQMRGFSGHEIKKIMDRHNREIPIIFLFMSTGQDIRMLAQGLELEAVTCVEKPFKCHELWSAIDFVMDRSRQRRSNMT